MILAALIAVGIFGYVAGLFTAALLQAASKNASEPPEIDKNQEEFDL